MHAAMSAISPRVIVISPCGRASQREELRLMIFGDQAECHEALNGLLADTASSPGGQFGNYVLKTFLAQVPVAQLRFADACD